MDEPPTPRASLGGFWRWPAAALAVGVAAVIGLKAAVDRLPAPPAPGREAARRDTDRPSSAGDGPPAALASLRRHWRWPAAALVLGVGVGLGLIGLAGLATVEFGLFDTTSTTPHAPIIAWATHETFIHSTRLRARDVVAPARFTAAEVLAGGQEYVADCEMCHGGPGVHRASWVRGMTPTPPFLLDTAERFTPGELYWIIARGVKMTSMPAWIETRSRGQIWDVVSFVSSLPKLTPADYARMKAAPTARQGP